MNLLSVTLLAAAIITSILSETTNAEKCNSPLAYVFEAFGYSQTCVASALTACEFSSKKEASKNVADLVEVIKSLLQEMKSGREREKQFNDALKNYFENVTNSLTERRVHIGEGCCHSVDSVELITETNFTSTQGKPEQKYFKNCAEIKLSGDSTSGVKTVYPSGLPIPKPVDVYCDQTTDYGGWTVIQNRDALPVRENFYRSWDEYVTGFGNLTGEYWLGLENIHALTNSSQMEIRFDLENYEGQNRWAKYGSFYIKNATAKYSISIEQYTGNAGNAFAGRNNVHMFTTFDQDNDITDANCAQLYKGGWWYDKCHASNLNGFQHVGGVSPYGQGIVWEPFSGYNYSLKKASMKVRPRA